MVAEISSHECAEAVRPAARLGPRRWQRFSRDCARYWITAPENHHIDGQADDLFRVVGGNQLKDATRHAHSGL